MVDIGNQRIVSGILCVLQNGTTSESFTITEGTSVTLFGFQVSAFGSISPTTLLAGYPMTVWYDDHNVGEGVISINSGINLGQAWLYSATAHGTTQLGSAASYTYTAPNMIWVWSSQFGFASSGTTSGTLVHN